MHHFTIMLNNLNDISEYDSKALVWGLAGLLEMTPPMMRVTEAAN